MIGFLLRYRCSAGAWIAAALLMLLTSPTAAQEPDERGALRQDLGAGVSPSLPPGHWSIVAARRLEALGLAEEFLPAQRMVPRDAVARVLRDASETPGVEARVAELARGWYRRFAEEFPDATGTASRSAGPVELLGSSAGAGYSQWSGVGAPGQGVFLPSRTGFLPRPDDEVGFAVLDLAVSLGSHVAVQAVPAQELGGGGFRWERFDVTAGWRSVAVAVGRQPVGYGAAVTGGVVLSGAASLDRVQLETIRPVRLPGWFDALGPVAFHTFFSRLSEDRHPGDPFLWGASGSLRPHPRLTLSVHRAALFGGAATERPVTPGNLLNMLLGRVEGDEFENQIVAAEVRVRLPTERLVPLTAYLEWGAEDAAGAWWDVPGRVVGILVPAVPGAPSAALGVEYSAFGESCCLNPPWYRHPAFTGSWAAEGMPLGHPLGGHGTELLIHGLIDLLDARVRIQARGFLRDRRSENLFAPGLDGESAGIRAEAAWRIHPRAEILLSGAGEDGDGWMQRSLRMSTHILFDF